jgi:hypothetical protein
LDGFLADLMVLPALPSFCFGEKTVQKSAAAPWMLAKYNDI